MITDETAPQLSPEALSILDQLVEIAHDEDPKEGSGIEWYLPDEEAPLDALDELARAGVAEHGRDGDSLVVELTEAGRARYA